MKRCAIYAQLMAMINLNMFQIPVGDSLSKQNLPNGYLQQAERRSTVLEVFNILHTYL